MFHWHQAQDRTLIYLHGEDWQAYLQGLITQDIALIEAQPLIYTHLLNAQGRYEGDCFITRWEAGVLMDFPRAVWKRLGAKLKLLKLRRDVLFQEYSEAIVLLSFEEGGGVPTGRAPQQAYKDPRLTALGLRYYCPIEDRPQGILMEEGPYDKLCLEKGIPQDEKGLLPSKTISLEAGLRELHGISFEKGCYVGQELMSRVHHQGKIRKNIFPFSFQGKSDSLSPGDEISNDNGTVVGTVSYGQGQQGFARLSLEAAKDFFQGQGDLHVKEMRLNITLPAWKIS